MWHCLFSYLRQNANVELLLLSSKKQKQIHSPLELPLHSAQQLFGVLRQELRSRAEAP